MTDQPPTQATHTGQSTERTLYRQLRFAAPPGATELVLVRHGASMPADPDDPFPLLDGQGDPPLAPEGQEQAERVAARLATERVDAIYVTNLRRTHETADPLARQLGLTPLVEPDLREVHLGEWEGGLYRQRAAQGDPLFVKMITEERWDVIPGGESHDSIRNRMIPAIERIAQHHVDQRVVLVLHGGMIGAILAHATGSRPFSFVASDNASIHTLVVHHGRWMVRRFNDTVHLDD